jgi:hypothetical protein
VAIRRTLVDDGWKKVRQYIVAAAVQVAQAEALKRLVPNPLGVKLKFLPPRTIGSYFNLLNQHCHFSLFLKQNTLLNKPKQRKAAS